MKLFIYGPLVYKPALGEALAIEGVPMGGMDGTVGVLDDDGVDGEKNVGGAADSKILTKGCTGQPFNLGGGKPARKADGVFIGFGDDVDVDAGFGDGAQFGVLQVEAVVVARLYNQFFSAAAIDPAVEDFMFDVERF